MEYLIRPTNDDLIHKSHKYVDKKMGRNGKWIYYYTTKPSLSARTGKYAKEKLQQQKSSSITKLANMSNRSREDAEKKRDQRNIELKKVEKAQAEYDATIRGKLEKFASTGMAYLERLGIINNIKDTAKASEEHQNKLTTGKTSIPRSSSTTNVSTKSYSLKPTKVRKRRKLRDK